MRRPSSHDVFAAATVMVVDDVTDNVVLLQQLLRRAGVDSIHTFTSSSEALQRLPALDPDLLILDLHMPDPDGFQVLEALQEMLPESAFLPVLVLTADASRATRQHALDLGAQDFLTKPIDTDEALLRARNLLETRALHRQLSGHNALLQQELHTATAHTRHAAEARRHVQARLENLLDRGGPTMVFQPIYDLGSHGVVGFEALARFPECADSSPSTWFTDADSVGRGVDLEMAAIRTATDRLADLPEGAFLSVNASVETAHSDALRSHLRKVPRESVVLELTEHARVEDYAQLVDTLSEHRSAGLRLAIDDTGAGYAGLHHLLQLQPDIVKLDIALTHGIDADPARRALALALNAFCTDVGAEMIAEGIETSAELEVLQQLTVAWGQGYHLARPGPLPLSA